MLELGSPTAYLVRPEARLTGALSTRNCYARIVATARELLIAHPGSSFTVQDIADATGLSRRAVYNHFPNPEALYRATLRDLLGELGDMVEVDLPREAHPEQAIQDFACFATALLSSDINLLIWAAIIRDDGAEDWLAAAYARLVRQPLVRSLEIYLLHRRIRDDLPRLDPERAAEQLVGMIEAASVTPSLLKTGHQSSPAAREAEILFIVASFINAHLAPREAVPSAKVMPLPLGAVAHR
ncbi:hypothetical protein ACFB49_48410 [Sphingomonas sp. DBB INV C78]|uniref:TetR/AcrR family transcriptional regulator n=1 Tax=Sphingomonas sp. DBB INV C78 TaxID=3349434 RepID=UPI0036D2EA16